VVEMMVMTVCVAVAIVVFEESTCVSVRLGSDIFGSVSVAVSAGAVVFNGIYIYIYIYILLTFSTETPTNGISRKITNMLYLYIYLYINISYIYISICYNGNHGVKSVIERFWSSRKWIIRDFNGYGVLPRC
jgi:hypothetical protein